MSDYGRLFDCDETYPKSISQFGNSKTMSRQRITILLFIIALTMSMFISSDIRMTGLEIGASLPRKALFDKDNQSIAKMDSLQGTIIICFHSDCEHCRYQLSAIAKQRSDFRHIQLFFITEDKKFFQNKIYHTWPELIHSSGAMFKYFTKKDFYNLFAVSVFPTIYLFDKKDKLRNKIYGEVKVEKILKMIAEFDVPEHE